MRGRRLVDGGIAADLPILQAERLGATTSYVLPRAVMAHPVHPFDFRCSRRLMDDGYAAARSWLDCRTVPRRRAA